MRSRKAISLILTASLILAPATPSFASNSVSDTERYVFLNSVADKVETILRSNITRLEFIKACFQGRNHPSCKAEVDRVRSNIKMKYDNIQQHIFLWHMISKVSVLRKIFDKFYWLSFKTDKSLAIPAQELIGDVASPLSQIKSLSHLPPYKFSPQITEKVMNQVAPQVAWKEHNSEKVTRRYNYNLKGMLELTCHRIDRQSRRDYGKADYDYSKAPQVCANLNIDYNPKTNQFVFQNTNARGIDRNTLLIVSERTGTAGQAIQVIEHKLYKSIEQMPYIGLVRSANPSNVELANVFQIMIQNAKEELKVVRKHYGQAFEGEAGLPTKGQFTKSVLVNSVLSLNPMLFLSRITNSLTSSLFSTKKQSEPEQVQINWVRAHGFLAYESIAESLVKDPNDRMQMMTETDFSTVYADTESTFANEEMWDLIGELSGTIALTMACYIPIGRAGSAGYRFWQWVVRGRALSFRSLLCIPLSGLAVNTYFYKQAMSQYHEVYRRVFSTLEGETLLAELRQLSDAEFNIVLEAIMFPIGVVSIKALGRVSGKLSSKSWNYLKSRI